MKGETIMISEKSEIKERWREVSMKAHDFIKDLDIPDEDKVKLRDHLRRFYIKANSYWVHSHLKKD